MFKKILSLIVIVCFFLTSLGPLPQAHADTVLGLPAPGTMVSLSPAFEPVLMKGIKVHPENPFKFDFIIDTGSTARHSERSEESQQEQLKSESSKLIKYFLASLTIPEKDLWVNLSPYEKDRMIANNLGQTQMGQDMLAQDYILKQLTASLIYPEKNLGKTFWDKICTKAQQMYGTTQIPVNTFNKVWIVADKADVFERGNVAYIVGAHLKVMLEEDYLSLSRHQQNKSHTLASQIIRELILPSIEQEVNTGKNFAPLRQMFYSMILASWYKMALKDALLTQVYGNQSKVKVGVNAQDPTEKDKIFQQYLKAYKKGVFNYIKEDLSQTTQQPIPRKYFSGGTNFEELASPVMLHRILRPTLIDLASIANDSGKDFAVAVTINPEIPDTTMIADNIKNRHSLLSIGLMAAGGAFLVADSLRIINQHFSNYPNLRAWGLALIALSLAAEGLPRFFQFWYQSELKNSITRYAKIKDAAMRIQVLPLTLDKKTVVKVFGREHTLWRYQDRQIYLDGREYKFIKRVSQVLRYGRLFIIEGKEDHRVGFLYLSAEGFKPIHYKDIDRFLIKNDIEDRMWFAISFPYKLQRYPEVVSNFFQSERKGLIYAAYPQTGSPIRLNLEQLSQYVEELLNSINFLANPAMSPDMPIIVPKDEMQKLFGTFGGSTPLIAWTTPSHGVYSVESTAYFQTNHVKHIIAVYGPDQKMWSKPIYVSQRSIERVYRIVKGDEAREQLMKATEENQPEAGTNILFDLIQKAKKPAATTSRAMTANLAMTSPTGGARKGAAIPRARGETSIIIQKIFLSMVEHRTLVYVDAPEQLARIRSTIRKHGHGTNVKFKEFTDQDEARTYINDHKDEIGALLVNNIDFVKSFKSIKMPVLIVTNREVKDTSGILVIKSPQLEFIIEDVLALLRNNKDRILRLIKQEAEKITQDEIKMRLGFSRAMTSLDTVEKKFKQLRAKAGRKEMLSGKDMQWLETTFPEILGTLLSEFRREKSSLERLPLKSAEQAGEISEEYTRALGRERDKVNVKIDRINGLARAKDKLLNEIASLAMASPAAKASPVVSAIPVINSEGQFDQKLIKLIQSGHRSYLSLELTGLVLQQELPAVMGLQEVSVYSVLSHQVELSLPNFVFAVSIDPKGVSAPMPKDEISDLLQNYEHRLGILRIQLGSRLYYLIAGNHVSILIRTYIQDDPVRQDNLTKAFALPDGTSVSGADYTEVRNVMNKANGIPHQDAFFDLLKAASIRRAFDRRALQQMQGSNEDLINQIYSFLKTNKFFSRYDEKFYNHEIFSSKARIILAGMNKIGPKGKEHSYWALDLEPVKNDLPQPLAAASRVEETAQKEAIQLGLNFIDNNSAPTKSKEGNAVSQKEKAPPQVEKPALNDQENGLVELLKKTQAATTKNGIRKRLDREYNMFDADENEFNQLRRQAVFLYDVNKGDFVPPQDKNSLPEPFGVFIVSLPNNSQYKHYVWGGPNSYVMKVPKAWALNPKLLTRPKPSFAMTSDEIDAHVKEQIIHIRMDPFDTKWIAQMLNQGLSAALSGIAVSAQRITKDIDKLRVSNSIFRKSFDRNGVETLVEIDFLEKILKEYKVYKLGVIEINVGFNRYYLIGGLGPPILVKVSGQVSGAPSKETPQNPSFAMTTTETPEQRIISKLIVSPGYRPYFFRNALKALRKEGHAVSVTAEDFKELIKGKGLTMEVFNRDGTHKKGPIDRLADEMSLLNTSNLWIIEFKLKRKNSRYHYLIGNHRLRSYILLAVSPAMAAPKQVLSLQEAYEKMGLIGQESRVISEELRTGAITTAEKIIQKEKSSAGLKRKLNAIQVNWGPNDGRAKLVFEEQKKSIENGIAKNSTALGKLVPQTSKPAKGKTSKASKAMTVILINAILERIDPENSGKAQFNLNSRIFPRDPEEALNMKKLFAEENRGEGFPATHRDKIGTAEYVYWTDYPQFRIWLNAKKEEILTRSAGIEISQPPSASSAMTAPTDTLARRGGIDFNRANMAMNVRKEGNGVQMQFDPAMIARIRKSGFDGVNFEVESIIPVANLPLLLGLRKEEIQAQTQLASV